MAELPRSRCFATSFTLPLSLPFPGFGLFTGPDALRSACLYHLLMLQRVDQSPSGGTATRSKERDRW